MIPLALRGPYSHSVLQRRSWCSRGRPASPYCTCSKEHNCQHNSNNDEKNANDEITLHLYSSSVPRFEARRADYKRAHDAVNGNVVTTVPLPSTSVAVPWISKCFKERLRVIGPV